MDTLALGYSLPATGRLRDFHPLEHAPAGRTTYKRAQADFCLRPLGYHTAKTEEAVKGAERPS